MAKIKKPQRGKPCPRCKSVSTLQHTNFGAPMRGRFTCFECKRTWDEVHSGAPDFVKMEKGKL